MLGFGVGQIFRPAVQGGNKVSAVRAWIVSKGCSPSLDAKCQQDQWVGDTGTLSNPKGNQLWAVRDSHTSD